MSGGCIGTVTWNDCDICANDDYYLGCILADERVRIYLDEEEMRVYCLDFKEKEA